MLDVKSTGVSSSTGSEIWFCGWCGGAHTFAPSPFCPDWGGFSYSGGTPPTADAGRASPVDGETRLGVDEGRPRYSGWTVGAPTIRGRPLSEHERGR
jgi:hypothetical protein